MATIIVSTDQLRTKARAIRTLLDEQKAAHQRLWTQISAHVSLLPADLRTSHKYANNSWHKTVLAHYDNYYQLALNMEAAADAYERGDKNVQLSFTVAD